MIQQDMDAMIVFNPKAGRGSLQKSIGGILDKFVDAGVRARLMGTGSKEDAERTIAECVAEEPDMLVCCGGDGTLNETVSALLRAGGNVPLGYIPAGTTNDFAVSLKIPREPMKAAEKILSGEARRLDVGRFGSRYFMYVASFGAFTQTSYSVTQNLKKTLGHLAYIIEGIKELPQIKSYHVCLKTEAEELEGDYIFGAVSNSTSLGGVIRLNPEEVDFSDGRFEIMLVKMPKNVLELNSMVVSLMSGKFDSELITFLHASQADFTCFEPIPWSLDGEYAEGGDRVEIKNIPGAVSLIC